VRAYEVQALVYLWNRAGRIAQARDLALLLPPAVAQRLYVRPQIVKRSHHSDIAPDHVGVLYEDKREHGETDQQRPDAGEETEAGPTTRSGRQVATICRTSVSQLPIRRYF